MMVRGRGGGSDGMGNVKSGSGDSLTIPGCRDTEEQNIRITVE